MGLPGGEGALINGVTEGSPAQKAGVKEEDVVVAIDGEKVSSETALLRVVAFKRPDSVVTLSVLRAGKPLELKVRLGVRPDIEKVGDLDRKPPEGGDARKRLGLSLQEVDPRMAQASGLPRLGALVADVAPGSPAEQAGLQRGMVVVELNRKAVRSRDELVAGLKELKPGSVALLKTALPGTNGRVLRAVEVP
jgi:serine protease Do